MLQARRNEKIQERQILLYERNGKGFEHNLQSIHNIIARYINTIVRELDKEGMTQRVRLYLGKGEYDGQEYLFLDFITQINQIIANGSELNQLNIDLLGSLLNNILASTNIHQEIFKDCTKQVGLAQKELNSQIVSSNGIKGLRILRKV
jgi:hypothetical protein